MNKPLFLINDLNVRFGSHARIVHAFNKVSIKIEEGETAAIAKKSAPGKSVSFFFLNSIAEENPKRISPEYGMASPTSFKPGSYFWTQCPLTSRLCIEEGSEWREVPSEILLPANPLKRKKSTKLDYGIKKAEKEVVER